MAQDGGKFSGRDSAARGVSIIIPAYNTEKYLPATLESVLAQTVADWEAIIIDDGSTDQTGPIAAAFARRDPRLRVLHQENAGISQARNRGFAETRPDYPYCLFLDSDDLLDPDTLEILLQALEKDPDAVGAHGYCRYIDSAGRPLAIDGSYFLFAKRRGIQGIRLKDWPLSAPTTFAVLAYSNVVPTGGLLIRKTAKAAVGGFDPSLLISEDYHTWLRLSLRGHLAFVNRAVLSYRRHGDNTTHRRRLMRTSLYETRKKLYAEADLDKKQRRIILMGYRYNELFRTRINLTYAVRKLRRGRISEAFKDVRTAMEHLGSMLRGNLSD